MNRRYLHHLWRNLQPISPWYFSLLFLLFAVLSVHGLRQNNLKMVELREQVAKVDEAGGDVELALRNLREHVYGHMNTNLTSGALAIRPPIQLKYRYERLVAAEKQRVATANEKVYTDAQNDCERRHPAGLSGSSRIPCVAQYVTDHGAKEQSIPDELYKFDFVSPSWSPDLAGWSLIATAVFGFLFVTRLLLEKWLLKDVN